MGLESAGQWETTATGMSGCASCVPRNVSRVYFRGLTCSWAGALGLEMVPQTFSLGMIVLLIWD